jgi:hypothetical protein
MLEGDDSPLACCCHLFPCCCHYPVPISRHFSLSSVNKGDRIAQLVLECIKTPPVEVVEDLDSTDRGAGGFGSTGGYTGQTGATN